MLYDEPAIGYDEPLVGYNGSRAAVRASVWAGDYSAEVAALTAANQRNWRDVLNQPGTGQLQFNRDDVGADAVRFGRVIRFEYAGEARFAVTVGPKDVATRAESGRPADNVTVVNALGTLSVFSRAFVYPDGGFRRGAPAHRLFNAASSGFDASSWANAVEIKLQRLSVNVGTGMQWHNETGPAPKGWTDGLAYWVWGQAQGVGSPPQPVGDCWFIDDFTVTADQEGECRIAVTWDDGGDIYLDGAFLGGQVEAFIWREFRFFDVWLAEGTHRLTVRGENIERPIAATNIAGTIWTVQKLGSGGVPGEVITRSDATAKTLAYPAAAPGMTATRLIRLLVEEAQARGALPGVTLGFSDTNDTAGVAMPTIDVGYRVGTKLIDVLRDLTQAHIDIAMRPDRLELQVWNKNPGRGADRTATVVLADAVNIGGYSHQVNPRELTAAVGAWLEGRYVESAIADDPDAGRIEEYLEVGAAASDVEAGRRLDAELDRRGVETTGYRVKLDRTAPQPYDDFDIGDTVTLPGPDRADDTARVEAIVVDEDQAGNLVVWVEA